MKAATELKIGRRYFDAEFRQYYEVLNIRGDSVDILCDGITVPETFDYGDLLRDAAEPKSSRMEVKVKRLTEDAILPAYQSAGAAGFDLHSIEDEIIKLESGRSIVVGTGLAFEIPEGFELEIRGRSGYAFKYRVLAFNGTIDSDYRGEVKLLIFNMGPSRIMICKGDRVAQGVIKRIEQADFVEATELSETVRGAGGLGSTGR